MTEPILDPEYWARRLEEARLRGLHMAVYECTEVQWGRIEDRHREILARHIKSGDTVLDAGCGYGRLVELLPEGVNYVGVDLCPQFIHLARKNQTSSHVNFHVGDLRQLPAAITNQCYEWGILVSVKYMVIRNCGKEVWQQMETNLRRVCEKLLFMEYNDKGEGIVE